MFLPKSPNVPVLAGILRKVKRGDDITYETLSKAVGVDIQEKGRGWLASARRSVRRSERIVFDAVPKLGLHAMTDEELSLYIQRKIEQSGKRDRRIVALANCVEARNVTAVTLKALEESLYVGSVAAVLKGRKGIQAARTALAANEPPKLDDLLDYARTMGSDKK